MGSTARLAVVALLALCAAHPAAAQGSTFYDLGELTQRGQRSVVTTPTVTVLDTSPEVDAQVVMYRVVWRPVVDASGTWRPTSAPPIEGRWLFTEVGEEGSGHPARSGEFLDAETREPVTSHHADLPPGTAHLVQVELQWFPAGSAQFMHQEVLALQVTQGPGKQPLPGLVVPNVQPPAALQLTPRALRDLVPSGTGFYVAPGLVLTNARAVAGRQTVLVGRGDVVREVRVHALDEALDLALLEHTMDAPPLPFRQAPLRPRETIRAAGCAVVDASGRVVGVQRADASATVSVPDVLRWLESRGVLPTITNGASPGRAGVEAASVRVYAQD